MTQQYIVDSYIKTEANRLNYIRLNQKNIRADTYQGLTDYFKTKTPKVKRPGRKIILPSKFIGSPRSQIQNYQVAMAIVTKFGKPDLFITFTCNPNWREINENIQPYEKASDRPDVVVRVFKQKLEDCLYDIEQRHCFGN